MKPLREDQGKHYKQLIKTYKITLLSLQLFDDIPKWKGLIIQNIV